MNYEKQFFGISIIKQSVGFNLTFFEIVKYDYVVKAIEIFSSLPLISNSVTVGSRFLLLIISAIMSSDMLLWSSWSWHFLEHLK